MSSTLVTVAETIEFQRAAESLWDAEELDALIGYLAGHPAAGVVIPSSGGVRKLRWAAGGKGKRGGARVIYYYRNQSMPLFLLTAFDKSRQSDLSASELRHWRSWIRWLKP